MTGTEAGKRDIWAACITHSQSVLRYHLRIAVALTLLTTCLTVHAVASENDHHKRPFTVSDDIALAQFGDIHAGTTDPFNMSPDGTLVAAITQRGVLATGRPEDELRVYRIADLKSYINHPERANLPTPIWLTRESTATTGMIISKLRWTRDSKGLAFLLKAADGSKQLMFSEPTKGRQTIRLSRAGQDVSSFDVLDFKHYVYTVTDILHAPDAAGAAAIVATGKSLADLFFPEYTVENVDRAILWAAVGGPPHEVVLAGTTHPVLVFHEGQQSLALSPDGRTLAVVLPLTDVPSSWVALYPAPYASTAHKVKSGKQNLDTSLTGILIGQYATLDLASNRIHRAMDAPSGSSGGWIAGGLAKISWSDDGRYIALPQSFIAGEADHSAPCLTVIDQNSGSVACVERVQRPYDESAKPSPTYRFFDDIYFAHDDLFVDYRTYDQRKGTEQYSKNALGVWAKVADLDRKPEVGSVQISIQQGLNDPPRLIAKDTGTGVSRVVWDPNPHLADVDTGEASYFTWKDKNGLTWEGGLYKPVGYVEGKKYPLVIQTHGFTQRYFLPSGIFPTAFAARALAAAGIMVVQVKGCPVRVSMTKDEAGCNVRGYEAAVETLAKSGMIDPNNVAIVGFSRTVYYVMRALTNSDVHFKAASVTDGVDFGYWQYLVQADLFNNAAADEAETIYGAKPFGAGIDAWKNAPSFELQNVSAPLLVVGEGRLSLLFMWDAYASLRLMKKPTELVLLRTNEHVLSDPLARLASQGGTVDWMRFWLQGYEDPTSTKVEQYKRWETLCDMQKTEHPGQPTTCIGSKQ